MKKNLEISFGLMYPTILMQLKKQKFKYQDKEVKQFNELREHITRLVFGGILSRTESDKCFMKLFKKIQAHVNKLNPMEV